MVQMFPFLIVLVFTLVIGVIAIIVMGNYAATWLQGYLAGANIPFVEIVAMTLRKVDAKLVVRNRVKAVQAGLTKAQEVNLRDLQAHYLAGGDIDKVVDALIVASRNGVNLSWSEAAAIDLSGKDVITVAQSKPLLNKIVEADTDIPAAGTILIDGNHVDAISVGEPIRRGERVQIVEVLEGMVVVRPV